MDPIQVYIHNGETLLVDGHHRLAAYMELGMENIPTKELTRAEFDVAAESMKRFNSPEALKKITSDFMKTNELVWRP